MDDVIILAGGKCPPDLAEASGSEWRADLAVNGKTMLSTVRDAVESWGEPLVIGGPQGIAPRQVPAGNSFVESLRIGMESTTGISVLMATVDLPFLTKESIQDFFFSFSGDADLAYPIVPAAVCERDFPTLKRTTLTLKEGKFTGGNIALLNREAVLKNLHILERAYEARKNPLELARIVGVGTLARLVVGKFFPAVLPIAKLESAVGRTLGFKVRAVITEHSGIGTDIDSLEQWRTVQAMVSF